jgi:hypothetical protein
MLKKLRCCGVRIHLPVAAMLVVMAVTMAAVCDWHSDLVYHPDCVLCHFAQLCLVSASTILILPPPVVSKFEISQAPIIHSQTSKTGDCLFRGPPA